MGRRAAVIWVLWAGVFADPAQADAQVLLGFIDSDHRFAVQGAVDGAAARLARPGCQDVLADFTDESGQSLRTKLLARGGSTGEAFAGLRFVDSRTAPQCRAGSRLAFTQTGSPVIHVCGQEFVKRSMRNRMTAEIIVIHEFLHTLGLGENPPTSQAITHRSHFGAVVETRTPHVTAPIAATHNPDSRVDFARHRRVGSRRRRNRGRRQTQWPDGGASSRES